MTVDGIFHQQGERQGGEGVGKSVGSLLKEVVLEIRGGFPHVMERCGQKGLGFERRGKLKTVGELDRQINHCPEMFD